MPSNSRPVVVIDPQTTGGLTSTSRERPDSDPIVFTLDIAGNFKFINHAGEKISGYSCEELRGMNFNQIIAPQFADRLRRQLRRNLRQRFGTVYQVEVLTKQGGRVRLETSIHFVRHSRGREIEIHGIALGPNDDSDRRAPRCLDEQFAFDHRHLLTNSRRGIIT